MKTNQTFQIVKDALLRATVIKSNYSSSLGNYESKTDEMVRVSEYGKCVDMLNGTGLEMKDKFVSEKQINFYTFKIIENNNKYAQEYIAEWSAFNKKEDAKSAAKQEREKEHSAKMRDIATEVAKELGITKKALFDGLKKNSKVLNDLRFKGTYNINNIKNILGI